MAGARYAVLVASSKFPDEPGLPRLTAPEKDVDGLEALLLSPDRGGFSDVIVLKNQPHYVINTNIQRVLRRAKKDDLVVVYYSGHGKLNRKGQLYLTTTDTRLDELESSSIGVVRIREFLDASQTKQVVIILDCCFSGAINGIFKSSTEDQLRGELEEARGTYIMTASTGIQTALQKEGDQYSVFTKHLIAGIETGEADTNGNGVITADELYDYLRPRVRDESHQEPTRWNTDARGHLVIANSGRQPRKERARRLRKLLFRLADEDRIDDDILTKGLSLIGRPAKSLSPTESACDALLDELHSEKVSPVSFLLEWIQLTSGQDVKSVTSDDSAEVFTRETASPKQEEQEETTRKFTEQESPDAQFSFGRMYAKGEGVAQDYVKAAEWLYKAAAQGHAAAQYELGGMYAKGEGVPMDDAKAIEWYRKAAKQGHGDAKFSLRRMYEGKVVEKRRRAEQGDAIAQNDLGLMYKNGEYYSEALAWFRKAAEQGHAGAQYELGGMYAKGEGVSVDDAEAAEWYCKAAEQGHADAESSLLRIHADAEISRLRMYEDNIREKHRGAEQGDAIAQNNLGLMYKYGEGVNQDYAEAVVWFRKAAEQGNVDAQISLGWMYRSGLGVDQDYAQTMGWYRKAAEQGSATAQYKLGEMYARGEGVPVDNAKAVEWYRKAAEQGHAWAKQDLDRLMPKKWYGKFF